MCPHSSTNDIRSLGLSQVKPVQSCVRISYSCFCIMHRKRPPPTHLQQALPRSLLNFCRFWDVRVYFSFTNRICTKNFVLKKQVTVCQKSKPLCEKYTAGVNCMELIQIFFIPFAFSKWKHSLTYCSSRNALIFITNRKSFYLFR